MAEPQDEEQWLYGDAEKEDTSSDPKETSHQDDIPTPEDNEPQVNGNVGEEEKDKEAPVPEEKDGDAEIEKPEESQTDEPKDDDKEKDEEEKEKDDDEEGSSSDDEPTVTIGKIVKQPDIIKPPPPTHRAAATTGLKDDDFEAIGKVNGVSLAEFNINDLEEKPWRKPGADLSDYFNYGFTEETWIKYCERHRAMRVSESGVGLGGLGGISKVPGSSNIPVSIVNENSKYGGLHQIKIPGKISTGITENTTKGESINTIQVMTAEKRLYSNKVITGSFDNQDFGGQPFAGEYYRQPPPYFSGPPPTTYETPSWPPIPNVPPPGWGPSGSTSAPPPQVDPYYEESNSRGYHSREKEVERDRSRERSREREERHRSPPRERESRHRRRSRSRSPSRVKHRKRSRSRSKSPSHRHKRKKSRRDKGSDNEGRD